MFFWLLLLLRKMKSCLTCCGLWQGFVRQQTHAGQMQQKKQGVADVAQDGMCDWLMSNKILDEIFVRNVHTEVLKRSIKVLLFLATNRRLGELEVKMIWDASLGQHESISNMIHELLSKTASQLHTPDVLMRMLSLIRQQPVSSFTAQHVNLAKRIATILVQLGTQIQMQGADRFGGIDFLWDIMQDDVRLGPVELHNMCITVFTQLIAMNECRVVRAKYFEKCIKNVKEHKSVLQSLVVMNGLFLSLASKRKKPDVDWSTFGCVKDEQELLSLIIEDLVQYCSSLSAEGGDSLSCNRHGDLVGTPRNRQGEVVGTPRGQMVRRQDQVSKRLEFITSILQLQGTSLSKEHLEALWTALVQPGIDERQRDVSLKWFQNLVENEWTREALASSLEALFQLTCNLDPSEVSESAFELFRRGLLHVNFKQGKVVYEGPERNHMIVATREKLLGTDFLWQVSVSAHVIAVADYAISLLNDIYQSVSSQMPNHQEVLQERRQEHIAACLDHMLRAAEDLKKDDIATRTESAGARTRARDENRMSRCICLLRKFLHDFELRAAASQPDFSIRKHGRKLLGGQILLKLQQFGQVACDAVVMPIDRAATLSLLRELVGKTLGEDPKSLRMIAKGKELKGDQKTVSEFRLYDADTVHWTKKLGETQGAADNAMDTEAGPSAPLRAKSHEFRSPHDILSQDHFDKIFELLAMPAKISMQVWELLMVFPTNQQLMEKIRALGPSLVSTLSPPGFFTQLYTLQIVEILLFEDDDTDTNPSWRENFINSGGVTHLLDMMLSKRFLKQDSDQCNECLAKLLNLLFITMIEGHRHKGDAENASTPHIVSFFKDSKHVESFVHMLLAIVRNSAVAANVLLSAASIIVETVAGNCLRLLVACVSRNRQMATFICTSESTRDWLADTIIHAQTAGIRAAVCHGVVKIACPDGQEWQAHLSSGNSTDGPSCLHPHLLFLEHLLSLVCDIKPGTSTCTDFFDLVHQMVNMTDELVLSMNKTSSAPDALLHSLNAHFDRTAIDLVALIKGSCVLEERNGKREDQVLLGHLRVLRSICAHRPTLRAVIGGSATTDHTNRCGLVTYLTTECLFGLPSVEQYAPLGLPKCKMVKTRSAAFELLFTLAQDCSSNTHDLLAHLLQQHTRREYRALYMYRPWIYNRAPCGFVGLRNLGATCYMNSLLQQLFFVSECRSSMLQVNVQERQGFMYQLQLLFAHLQQSEKQYYDPWELCQVYTDYDGQPVNISQQMDVDEFLNVLFEKVEQGLRNTPQKDMLRNCFGGKIVHQIICKEAVTVGDREFTLHDPYKSEREESFYTLQLEVKHKRSILESLRLYVDGEALEGDNKYLCEEANKKVDAVKRICIKELPQTLILHLKRFEFDLDFMKKVKVNDCCEFPFTLDMDPYTLDGIDRREKAAAEAINEGLDGIKAMEDVESAPDSEYELVGVLIHTGTADSGHYYSYIKERAVEQTAHGKENLPKWHLFNDMHVEPFDGQELGPASFGGSEYVEDSDPPDSARRHSKVVPRSYNAYMLFYERRSAKQPAPCAFTSEEGLNVARSEDVVEAAPAKHFVHTVLEDNIGFLRDKHMYDPDYFSFLKRVCSMPMKDAIEDKAFMLAVNVLMDCVIHSWDTQQIARWVEILKTKLLPDPVHAKRSTWLLDSFTHSQEIDGRVFGQHWLRKALLTNRVVECRTCIVELLMHAVKNLVPFDRRGSGVQGPVPYCAIEEGEDSEIQVVADGQLVPSLLSDHPYARVLEYRGCPFPRPVTTVGKFMENVLDLLTEVPRYWRYYGEYFQLLACFANIGDEEKKFLLSRRTISRSIDSVLLDESVAGGNATRSRSNLGDQCGVPDCNHLLALISVLTRSVKLEREIEDTDNPPTQMCDAGPMDPACWAYIKKPRFLSKALSDAMNPAHTVQLLLHMSWNNSHLSTILIDTLVAVIDDAHEDEMDILLKMLDKLVSMKDKCQEMRADHMVGLLLRMVVDKGLYAHICTLCLEFLEKLVSRNPHVRLAALKVIIQPQHEDDLEPRWFERCLINCEMAKVQLAWESFARVLLLPEIYTLKLAAMQQSKTEGRMPPIPRVHGDHYAQVFFENLVRKNDKIVMMGCQHPRNTSSLKYYLKLLSFVLENTDDVFYKHTFFEHFHLFHSVLKKLNEHEGETDCSKAELLRLMLLACNGSAEMLDVYTAEDTCVRQTLVSNFILIRPHRNNVIFNRQHLPGFYRLLLVCCQHRTSFIEHLMKADEFHWAITHIMCKSTKYPETADVMLQIIDVMLSSKATPDCVEEFRERVLDVFLRAKDLSANPQSAVDLSMRLVVPLLEEADKNEGLFRVLESWLIDALLAAVGACHTQHALQGQRVHAQPEVRALAVAVQAIGVLHKIIVNVRPNAAEEDEDAKEAVGYLRDALSKSKMATCDHRQKALSSMLLQVLPAISVISIADRLTTLKVANALCACDAQCSIAGVNALIRLHDETKLTPVEILRREHLQGTSLPDSKAIREANADALTGPKTGEQEREDTGGHMAPCEAWVHMERRAHVQSTTRVIMLGPACRARIGAHGTVQENMEMEAMYATFSTTLCKKFLAIANSAKEHMPHAVHLILRCALDLLPLAMLPGLCAIQELLFNCAIASPRANDVPGGKAKDAGAADSTGEQLAALQQENLTFDWVERVMVCYKEVLEKTTLSNGLRMLLCNVVPSWPKELVQRINDTLVADLTQLATATATLTDAPEISASDVEKAETVARAVLRELRPLVIVDEVPIMLAGLVENHGEAACVAAAEEALQAVNCRQLAGDSSNAPLAACLSEIDSIVLGHQEAIKRAKKANKPQL